MKDGWKMKKLGEVCLFENGDRGENYPSKSVQTTSGVPFINAGHLTDFGIDYQTLNFIPRERFDLLGNGKIRKNDILFCLRGSLGKFACVGKLSEGAIASSLVIVRPCKSVLKSYVLAYFQSDLCAEMISKFKNGAAQPNLSAGNLKEFKIPLPALPEQQRIVAILDEAFEGIATAKANADKNLKNARQLFESHLNSVFSQRGEGWVEKRLGQVCQTGAGGTPLKSKKAYYEGGTIPWLLSGEVSQGQIHKAKHFISQQGLENSSAKIFPKNTVLVAMYGATAGQVGILKFEASTNQAVCGILPNDRFVPEYLFYFFLSQKDSLVAQAAGNAQPNISQLKIKNTAVPILSLSEQQEIVERFDFLRNQTQRLESIYQKKIEALDALKKSILQKAFSGKM